SMRAELDVDDAANTPPDCAQRDANRPQESGRPQDANRLALRLSQFKIVPQASGLPQMRGHLMVRTPLALADRFGAEIDGTGWVGFSGDFALDGSSRLPEVSGRLRGSDMGLMNMSAGKRL